MVIKESIEIFRDNTSIEKFKIEIELLKSAGYKLDEEQENYVRFYQTVMLVDSDSIVKKKRNKNPTVK